MQSFDFLFSFSFFFSISNSVIEKHLTDHIKWCMGAAPALVAPFTGFIGSAFAGTDLAVSIENAGSNLKAGPCCLINIFYCLEV